MKIRPPGDLFLPITDNKSSSDFWTKPQSYITPQIDGKKDSFFEWLGCGIIDETKLFSTMQGERGPVEKVYYGEDAQKFYFSFEGTLDTLCEEATIVIIIEPLHINAVIAFNAGLTLVGQLKVESACQKTLELSIEKEHLQADEISIRFEINNADRAVQSIPGFGELPLSLHDDYSKNWYI